MRRVFLAAAVLAMVVSSGCYSRVSESIFVGQLAPPRSDRIGKQARQGVELAVDETNEGENAPLGRHVQVIQPEGRPNADVAADEAVRLITVNRVVALLGDTRAAEAERIAVATRSYGTALVTSSSLSAGNGVENLFATGLSPAARGEALARFVKDGLEPRPTTVAVFVDAEDERARAAADAFLHELKDSSVQPERRTFKNESDVPDLAAHLEQGKPGAVLMVGGSPDLVRRLREKVSAGSPKRAWLYAGDESQMTALQEDPAAAREVYLATAYAVDNGSPRGQEFARKYRERFKQDPDVHAALAYEDALILFEALRHTRAGTAPQVRDELANLQTFEGVAGRLAFKDHAVQRPTFVVRVEEKGIKLLKKCEFGGR